MIFTDTSSSNFQIIFTLYSNLLSEQFEEHTYLNEQINHLISLLDILRRSMQLVPPQWNFEFFNISEFTAFLRLFYGYFWA